MIKTIIPRNKYSLAVYPNMDPNSAGIVIPERYGVLKNLVPVCIDLTTGKWKLNYREIKAITEVREAGLVLDSAADYAVDLANAEFTIGTTPLLQPSTVYYFVLESDYAIDGVNYLGFVQQPDGTQYAGGTCYLIDGAGTWVDQSADLYFKIYVKDSIDGQEYVLIDNFNWTEGWNVSAYLRKAAANTRLAQSFTTPAGGPWYISRIQVEASVSGALDNIYMNRISLLSDYTPAEIPLGTKSTKMNIMLDPPVLVDFAAFPQRAAATDLSVDIEGRKIGAALMDNVADITEDIYKTLLGGTTAGLNAADLSALKISRPEPVALNLDTEIEFGDLRRKLEAGQLWKLLPLLDGTFGMRYAASGEPAGTPHYRDEHFMSFKMRRVWGSVYQTVKIKYDQDGGSQTFKIAEASSDIARYFYRSTNTLEVETYLTLEADALQAAMDYLALDPTSSRKQYLDRPLVFADFELVKGIGWDLIPTQKIKLTRSRAMSATGILVGVLFRVMAKTEHPSTGTVSVTALLDSLTY